MQYFRIHLLLSLLFLSAATQAEDEVVIVSKVLVASLAQRAATAALNTCDQLGYQVGVSVVDRNGNLMAFVRDPLSGPHTIDISEKKAFTSASTRVSTASLHNRPTLNFADRLITVRGGMPISIGGNLYGGIGVSGATPQDDEICALAGIDAIKEDIEFSQ